MPGRRKAWIAKRGNPGRKIKESQEGKDEKTEM